MTALATFLSFGSMKLPELLTISLALVLISFRWTSAGAPLWP